MKILPAEIVCSVVVATNSSNICTTGDIAVDSITILCFTVMSLQQPIVYKK